MIAVVLLGTAAFLLWWIPPENNGTIPQCPVLKLTGFYCSGCGSLRAVHSFLHGNLVRAWTMNPLTVLLLPLLAVLIFEDLLRGRNTAAQKIRPVYIWVLLGVFIAFGILRNLPIHPFTCLAPH